MMSTKTTLALALAAGFLGGIASQRLAAPVFAQTQTPGPKEIRAESFVVVDGTGTPRGVFGIDTKNQLPAVEIIDSKGHAYRARFDNPSESLAHWFVKPSLVPQQ